MSKYAHQPLDLSGLRTIPIQARGGKVRVEDFARAYSGNWLDSLPHILAADSFRAIADSIATAKSRNKMILLGLVGHFIKSGLSPLLSDLMLRGCATPF